MALRARARLEAGIGEGAPGCAGGVPTWYRVRVRGFGFRVSDAGSGFQMLVQGFYASTKFGV
jgi:hypothetical protein